MSIFNKLKGHAGDVVGNERIGEIKGNRNGKEDEQLEVKPMSKPKKSKGGGVFANIFAKKDNGKKKTSRSKDDYDINDNQLVQQVAMNSEAAQEEEDVAKYIKTKNVGGRTRSIVLSQLGITEQITVPSYLVTPEQIETVEFTPTMPTGLSIEEVNSFCDDMEIAFADYRSELIKQMEDKERLIDEIIRIERQILEDRNQNMLESFMADGSSEREKMRESLISTQLANKELEEENKKLKTKTLDPKVIEENKKLKTMVQNMKAQVEASASQNGTEELTAKLLAAQEENAKLNQMIERLKNSSAARQQSSTRRAPIEGQSANKANSAGVRRPQPQSISRSSSSSDDDYERKVMEQFNKEHGGNKRVRKPSSNPPRGAADDVVIPGFSDSEKKSSTPSGFDDMLNEFKV